jgi:hypothetical protein
MNEFYISNSRDIGNRIRCEVEVRLVRLDRCCLTRTVVLGKERIAILESVTHESANCAQVSIANFKSENELKYCDEYLAERGVTVYTPIAIRTRLTRHPW